MDGENSGKPLLKWMIWGIRYTPIFGNTQIEEFAFEMAQVSRK